MPYQHLQKVDIIQGSDMFPAILPDEKLLLDKNKKIRNGDLIVFTNRFGKNICHRVIHQFLGYYFTRGDNCKYCNFPEHKSSIKGVIHNKYVKPRLKRGFGFFANVFLIYFILYKFLFNIKRKKNFIILDLLTATFYPLERTQFNSSYNKSPDYANEIILSWLEKKYGKKKNINDVTVIKKEKDSYYSRYLFDNNILEDKEIFLNSNNAKLQFKKSEILSSLNAIYKNNSKNNFQNKIVLKGIPKKLFKKSENKGTQKIIHLFEQSLLGIYSSAMITLKDIVELEFLRNEINSEDIIPINNGGKDLYELYLSIISSVYTKYDSSIKVEYKQIHASNYSKVHSYLKEQHFIFPVYFMDFHENFPIYRSLQFLTLPRSYNKDKKDYSLFNIPLQYLVKIKNIKRKKYMSTLL